MLSISINRTRSDRYTINIELYTAHLRADQYRMDAIARRLRVFNIDLSERSPYEADDCTVLSMVGVVSIYDVDTEELIDEIKKEAKGLDVRVTVPSAKRLDLVDDEW